MEIDKNKHFRHFCYFSLSIETPKLPKPLLVSSTNISSTEKFEFEKNGNL